MELLQKALFNLPRTTAAAASPAEAGARGRRAATIFSLPYMTFRFFRAVLFRQFLQ